MYFCKGYGVGGIYHYTINLPTSITVIHQCKCRLGHLNLTLIATKLKFHRNLILKAYDKKRNILTVSNFILNFAHNSLNVNITKTIFTTNSDANALINRSKPYLFLGKINNGHIGFLQ